MNSCAVLLKFEDPQIFLGFPLFNRQKMFLSFKLVAAGNINIRATKCRSSEPTEMCTGIHFIHGSVLRGLQIMVKFAHIMSKTILFCLPYKTCYTTWMNTQPIYNSCFMNETNPVMPICCFTPEVCYLWDKVPFMSWPFAVDTVLQFRKACLLHTCN